MENRSALHSPKKRSRQHISERESCKRLIIDGRAPFGPPHHKAGLGDGRERPGQGALIFD